MPKPTWPPDSTARAIRSSTTSPTAIVSDGDLMEGVASEAASLAGHLKLGKLIYLYDDNRVTLASSADVIFTEDVAARFQAYGWHTQHVEDGNDLAAIDRAIRAARDEEGRPSLILVRTHLGYGAPHAQDTTAAHGAPLGEEEVKLTKENLGWPTEPPFYIPDEAARPLPRGRGAMESGPKAAWGQRFEAYAASYPSEAAELRRMIAGELPEGWDAEIPTFDADPKGIATRVASGKVMNAIAPQAAGADRRRRGPGELHPYSAEGVGRLRGPAVGGPRHPGLRRRRLELRWAQHPLWRPGARDGRHRQRYGRSRRASCPSASTFLIFSDYMRPPMRLAAMMSLHTIYVFTHDSIGLGEDGPTHEPVEQLAGLRAVPSLTVIRPADANETAVAWKVAVETPRSPGRPGAHSSDGAGAGQSEVRPGGRAAAGSLHPLRGSGGRPQTHPHRHWLRGQPGRSRPGEAGGAGSRQPGWSRCRAGSCSRRSPGVSRRGAASQQYAPASRSRPPPPSAGTAGWATRGDVIGIDRFGASAPGDVVLREYGFTAENVVARALALREAGQLMRIGIAADHGGYRAEGADGRASCARRATT